MDAELRRSFETRVEGFEHEGISLDMLLPRAAEELIDEAEFEADERLPYRAELWPSARALARHLLEVPPPAGRVLELGCGVALPSLVLLARGARVLATDYYADALRFAQANAARNALPPLPTALLDWRRIPHGFARSRLILVADVLYEQRNVEPLAEALPRLIEPGGCVLLADPGRVYLGEFRTRLQAMGWEVRELSVREETSDPASGAVSRVQLLELWPPGGEGPSSDPVSVQRAPPSRTPIDRGVYEGAVHPTIESARSGVIASAGLNFRF
jgi:predicted nicotinamide N-methyase